MGAAPRALTADPGARSCPLSACSAFMAGVVLLRGALGLLGVISLPDDNAWLEITTLGEDDGNPASKMFKGRSDGGAGAAAGGAGQGKLGGAQPRPGTTAARAAGVTEATPLLGAGSAAPAFEGIRPKAASKDEDRACLHTQRLTCKGHCTPRAPAPSTAPGAAPLPWLTLRLPYLILSLPTQAYTGLTTLGTGWRRL